MKILKKIGNKPDLGEVWLEKKSDNEYYLKGIFNKTGKIETFAKFKKPKSENRIDVDQLDKRVSALITQVNLLNGFHSTGWIDDPLSYQVRVTEKHKCDYLIDNTTIRPSLPS